MSVRGGGCDCEVVWLHVEVVWLHVEVVMTAI